MERPFFNSHQGVYYGSQPSFYDVEKIEGIRSLEAAYKTILQELQHNLADERRAKACFKKNGLKWNKGWRQIELKIYGVDYPSRTALFPKTMKVLDSIQGVSTAYFSLLEANSRIQPHVGDSDAFFRIHLGLVIPDRLPLCGLEVAGQGASWEEGKCMAFNDIYCHQAWNDTDDARVVLIVDILRPVFRGKEIYVNSGVRATLYYVRLYEVFFPVIELMPRIITRLGRPAFHVVSYIYHALRSRYRGGI